MPRLRSTEAVLGFAPTLLEVEMPDERRFRGYRPPAPIPPSDAQRLDRMAHKLDDLLQRIDRGLEHQDGAARRDSEIHSLLLEVLQMAKTAAEQIARLTQDVADTRGAIASAVTYIQGVPGLVRTAVEEALAANPGADLSALSTLADGLEASEHDLTGALSANGEGNPPAPAVPPAGGSTPAAE